MRRLKNVHIELTEPASDNIRDTWSQVKSVTVELLRAGQEHAYGPSVREGTLTFTTPEGQMWSSRFPQSDEQVLPYIKLLIGHFEPEGQGDWASPRLKILKRTGDRTWHVRIEEPYLD